MQGSECYRTGGVAGLRSLDRELSLPKGVALASFDVLPDRI